jgi:hypothetical protein
MLDFSNGTLSLSSESLNKEKTFLQSQSCNRTIDLSEDHFNLIWNARSRNKKTGDVPTLYIGYTKQEAWESCNGCPLRGNGCYAWSGSVNIGASSTRKARNNGADKTLSYAIANRHPNARMIRLSAIGDIGRCSSHQATEIKETISRSGLQLVGYTHHWIETKVANNWKGTLMASCETIADADFAVSQGWRATCIVSKDTVKPFKSPAGNRVVVCPAQTAALLGKTVTCNSCRLCDASKTNLSPIVAFIVHGNQSEKVKLK